MKVSSRSGNKASSRDSVVSGGWEVYSTSSGVCDMVVGDKECLDIWHLMHRQNDAPCLGDTSLSRTEFNRVTCCRVFCKMLEYPLNIFFPHGS